jgi:hypothetical protein
MLNNFVRTVFFSFAIIFYTQATHIKQLSALNFIKEFPQAICQQCTHKNSFDLTPYPLYQKESQQFFPSKGNFSDMFILTIPNGSAYLCDSGDIFVNNCFIKETQIKNMNYFGGQEFEIQENSDLVAVSGRVAIISHLFPECYGHWIFDVLGQLALLEINNISYDYLCAPYGSKFMQETLDLWGIDQSKIIPLTKNLHIQADAIILATAVTQTSVIIGKNANYNADFLLKYVSKKLLNSVDVQEIEKSNQFYKKIFISRKEAIRNRRFVPN